jgi:transglutaminase 1
VRFLLLFGMRGKKTFFSSLKFSPDDEGLLLGNWTDDFSGGVAPTKWGGSVEIMQRFYRKRRPVKVSFN